MMRSRIQTIAMAVALLASGCAPWGAAAKSGPAAAPSLEADRAITAEKLYLHEELWPYHVRLTRSWGPEGGNPIPRPIGVLLRVNDAERARIDFSTAGIHDVPIDATDLVARANENLETGASLKSDNLTISLASALVDPTSEEPRSYPRQQVAFRDLLLVAAPLDPELLRPMGKRLAEIDRMDGVRVIFLAQGGASNQEIYAALHAVGWTTPYLRAGFVADCTEGHLGPDPPIPGLGLFTPNGRLLHRAPWKAGADLEDLRAVISARAQEREAPPKQEVTRMEIDAHPAL